MSERIPAGGPFRAAAGLHESLTLEHLREARQALSYFCSSGGFCGEYLERMLEVARAVAELRINDLAWKKGYVGLDRGVMEIYQRLVHFYSHYIAGVLVTVGEDVLVRSKANLDYGGLVLVKGDVTMLKVDLAASLYVAGLVEPVESNAIRLGAARKHEGREPGAGVQGR